MPLKPFLIHQAFFAGYPGFDAFAAGAKDRAIGLEVINKRLTQSLGRGHDRRLGGILIVCRATRSPSLPRDCCRIEGCFRATKRYVL